MGVQVSITLHAHNQATAERAATAAFKRFADLEQIMSDYRPDSELMRLCAKAGGPPVPVSKDLFTVLERAQEVARRSDGAFDVTVGPVVQLWRTARRTSQMPSRESLDKALALVGWRKLILDSRARTARLTVPGMKLDLGGIGKGYADDCAIRELKRLGIKSALVEAGGDIVVSNPPPGTAGWRVKAPNVVRSDPESRGLGVVWLENGAISTSGDENQFVDIGGKRYSHVVDPHTGIGLTDRMVITVIARDGLTSDPLTKVVAVLGPEQAAPIIKQYHGAIAYAKRFGG